MHYILLYNYTINDVFDNFPKTLQELSEGHTNVSEYFPKFSQTTEDCRTQRVKHDFKHYVIDITVKLSVINSSFSQCWKSLYKTTD